MPIYAYREVMSWLSLITISWHSAYLVSSSVHQKIIQHEQGIHAGR